MPTLNYHTFSPPSADSMNTTEVLLCLNKATGSLAELKGRASAIPNQAILINTLALQEAQTSSEIEGIVTTRDEMYKADLTPEERLPRHYREVFAHRATLELGRDRMTREGGISCKMLTAMFQRLMSSQEEFRKTQVRLENESTGEIDYIPPPSATIEQHMSVLERFINDDTPGLNHLVKMAIIHHEFESIHPFSDGNGRIGRILNVLYLTHVGLLDTPILYLSRFINDNKRLYYRFLQGVRESDGWEKWILYMLQGVDETAKLTLHLVHGIQTQMMAMKHLMRRELPYIYSQGLLNMLFRHPYTRIIPLTKELDVSRQTAAGYLNTLAEKGFLVRHQAGRSVYYINVPLIELFQNVRSMPLAYLHPQ